MSNTKSSADAGLEEESARVVFEGDLRPARLRAKGDMREDGLRWSGELGLDAPPGDPRPVSDPRGDMCAADARRLSCMLRGVWVRVF